MNYSHQAPFFFNDNLWGSVGRGLKKVSYGQKCNLCLVVKQSKIKKAL